MGIFNILKGKKKETALKDMAVPPAPPSYEDLPDFPPKKNIKKIPVKHPNLDIDKIEDAALKEQQEILDEREELTLTKPIFIPLDNFRDISDEICMIQNVLKENDDTLARVSEFKEDEDKEFVKWEAQVKDAQKKLIYVDKILFGKR